MKYLKHALFVVCITVFAFSVLNLSGIFMEYHNGENEYSELSEFTYEKPKKENTEWVDDLEINYDELKAINNDFVGWIKINDTPVNYPVVHGKNNEYYLHHTFYGKSNFSGAIFMNAENTDIDLDQNVIIYGHNMKNKTMFQPLINFKEKQFFEKNKYIILTVNNKEYKYEIFASYLIDANVDELKISFSSNEDFLNYIKKIKEKSLYNRNLNIKNDDKIITLSTCSYETKSTRIAVCGKLIK